MQATDTKRRAFRTFSYRGVSLEALLEMKPRELADLFRARQRRRYNREPANTRKYRTLISKLLKRRKETAIGEKPVAVKTHLRNCVVVPEMVGSIAAVYNGQKYINVEIKPEMIGYYLGEFSLSYQPVSHGKPGIGATHSSRFIPLK